MVISSDTTVADIATYAPATISVFQRYHIDFCCGGRVPLRDVCADQGLDADAILDELRAVASPGSEEPKWTDATMTELIGHIQRRYHEPLRDELPRLDAMLDKVVSRHGAHLPDVLLPLQATFKSLEQELLEHMHKEDRVLFPAIVTLEGAGDTDAATIPAARLVAPIAVMEAEHESAGEALQVMRQLTGGYAPPDWACPTFRGLYYGLAQLEADMHRHVHLENHVLFPRAARAARQRA